MKPLKKKYVNYFIFNERTNDFKTTVAPRNTFFIPFNILRPIPRSTFTELIFAARKEEND